MPQPRLCSAIRERINDRKHRDKLKNDVCLVENVATRFISQNESRQANVHGQACLETCRMYVLVHLHIDPKIVECCSLQYTLFNILKLTPWVIASIIASRRIIWSLRRCIIFSRAWQIRLSNEPIRFVNNPYTLLNTRTSLSTYDSLPSQQKLFQVVTSN